MKKVILWNLTNDLLITSNCILADTFKSRYKGLIGNKKIDDDFCLALIPCNQIHMFFMKFAIDVIYLDNNNKVCGIDYGLKPWKIGTKRKNVKKVLEFNEGFVKNKINLDDILVFKENEVVI